MPVRMGTIDTLSFRGRRLPASESLPVRVPSGNASSLQVSNGRAARGPRAGKSPAFSMQERRGGRERPRRGEERGDRRPARTAGREGACIFDTLAPGPTGDRFPGVLQRRPGTHQSLWVSSGGGDACVCEGRGGDRLGRGCLPAETQARPNAGPTMIAPRYSGRSGAYI